MIAVFVNCLAIIAGSMLGLVFAGRFSKNIEESIQTAAGIVVLVLGLQMAFRFSNIIYFTLALILGGIAGTVMDLDGKILALGKLLERMVVKEGKSSNFAYAFLNSSVLFCVGAMAVIGSLKAGIDKDYSIIFTKSILDGFMAISFTAAMGIGTAFSSIMILLYQGALTLLSFAVEPYCTEQMIAELTGCGGAMIVMIGINLLKLRVIKTANYLPSLVFTVVFVLLDPWFSSISFR